MKKFILALLLFSFVSLVSSANPRHSVCKGYYQEQYTWQTITIEIEESNGRYQVYYWDRNRRPCNQYQHFAAALNPNNDLAKNNNLTHYVSTQEYGTIYFSIYECQ